jgi:hypothetical protein
MTTSTTHRGARFADEAAGPIEPSEITLEWLRENRPDLVAAIVEQAEEAADDPEGVEAAAVVSGDPDAHLLAQAWTGSPALRQRFKASGVRGFLRWAQTERKGGRDIGAGVQALGGAWGGRS